MKRGLISLVAAVGVMSALVIAPAETASAYPPGTAMTVSSSPNPVSVTKRFTATSTKVKPGCRVKFTFNGVVVNVNSARGSASTTFTAPSRVGNYRLTAVCANGESAATTVKVVGRAGVHRPGGVHGPNHVCVSKSFTMDVTNFAPRTNVTVVLRKATSPGGSDGRTVSFSKTSRTDNSGNASYRFNVNRTGVYVVSAVAEGQRAASALSVERC